MTLAELITAARQRADMVNSTFIQDAEWTSYINSSYAELYDILVSRFEDYFTAIQNFTISTGNTYTLPAALYKIRGIDFSLTSDSWATLRKYNFDERNRVDNSQARTLRGNFDRQYRVMGSKLYILPEGSATGSYRLWYIPRFTPLVSSTDEASNVLDFEEYIVVDAAIKALIKEESDTQVLMVIKQQLKDRIEAMAANRDTQPERIADVTSSEAGLFLFPRN
jgi:hypothetical protein